ncbi:16S rRNA (cytosine(1402)-N(4))-methyltransferase RsmH [[Mycoplasma] mobile]|uniref:Ribosomal RNA small subunit methyltransferase H n=1 Tax=Mycoplasma mobile (strain ATCC 43663 / 163K / NCTC 11711) TaxID=267748 RepID=RSMH_MYCM1|nr:16S rRNA (cytosine(1402)-N(4))-methyltransferase RsmH [[Mycoplasma] mobile]Q6KHR2.1 RecName: Full=Ribosomal RNA small subunit methyltransferase H; AltName: Full=16S rRNA m(4)C1402 methyltransferase; AltName: Full=rRNA (cytosine-N(4)-)-methyltransferase RsmH [Mycoplasma mobile 163K]AAT27866.1 S-adenosylmethionine-dependent methyltransferase [Mycoplasma mobile 163K]
MESNVHIPILLNEVLSAFNLKETDVVIDLTLGRAGHSQEMLKKIPKGLLIGIDKDKSAITFSKEKLEQIGSNFKLFHSDFSKISDLLKELKISKVNAILIDLGISSPQIDNANRGFSYNKESRLDMRMNLDQKLDAHFIVNSYSEEQLKNLLYRNAEIKNSRQIAKIITSNRPIETTLQLSVILKKYLPAFIVRKKDPSKAVFQALRVEVNDEINSLNFLLKNLVSILEENGKVAIITFNSIEDRIVKKYFGSFIKDDVLAFLPTKKEKEFEVKTYLPSKKELEENPRSKSAKMRVLKKIER